MTSSSWIRILLLVLAAMLAVACGGGSEAEPKASEASADTEAADKAKAAAAKVARRSRIPGVEPVAPSPDQLAKAVFLAVQDPGIQENANIFLYDESGKTICPITKDGINKYDVSLSHDGKWLAFMVRPKIKPTRKDVWVLNMETGESINLTENFPSQADMVEQRDAGGGADIRLNESPSFSMDNSRVIFGCKPLNGTSHLYSVPVTGGQIEQLTEDPAEPERANRYLEPDASPTSNLIVFARLGEGGASKNHRQLWLFDPETRKETRLTENADGLYRSPTWSPDGERIAFISKASVRNWDIWVINADGTGLEKLTDTPFPGDELAISWRPDGKSIAFIYREIEDTAENNEVYTIDVETHEIKPVSRTPMFESSPNFLQ